MTRPTRQQLDALIAAVNPPRDLGPRLWTHLERERRGGASIADGFPTATMGGSGTSGSGGDVVLTSVEAAVEVRLSGTTRDTHRTHTLAALRDLQRAADAIASARGHLRALDLADKPDKVNEEAWCRHHLRSYPEGDARGRVPASPRRPSRELCERCATFEDAEKELPPTVILDRWAQGKRPTAQQVDMALGRSYGVTALGAKVGWAK